MPKHDTLELLFKRIATDYIDTYGEELRAEHTALSQSNVEQITPSLDAKVKRGKDAIRRSRFTRGFGIVAACALIAIILPVLYQQSQTTPNEVPALEQAAVYSQAPSAAAEEAIAKDSLGEAPVAEAPAMEEPTAEDTLSGQQAYQPIPLGFELPEQFSISKQAQDKGKTIYYLNNTELDDVVLTMQFASELPDTSGLKEVPINTSIAYGEYNPDFSRLVFIQDGILYELSSEHDLNTLIQLGRSILV